MTTPSTKECVKCGQTKELSKFENGRVTCSSCRRKAFQQRTSASYSLFLRNLYTKAKTMVLNKKRVNDHVWEITPQDLIDKWEEQGGRCAISGVILTHHIDGGGHKDFNASLDRISPEHGYTADNVQLVAYRINIMKHSLSEDMLFWWIKTIHDFSCD